MNRIASSRLFRPKHYAAVRCLPKSWLHASINFFGFSGASLRRYTDAKPAGDQQQNSPFAEISPSPAPAPPAYQGGQSSWLHLSMDNVLHCCRAEKSAATFKRLANRHDVQIRKSSIWCESCRLSSTMNAASALHRFGGAICWGCYRFNDFSKPAPYPPSHPGFTKVDRA